MLLGPVMVAIAACGANGTSASGHLTPSPTVTLSSGSPAPENTPLLVVADPSPYAGQSAVVVRFFSLAGREASRITLAVGDQVVGATGARVFVLTMSGKLRGLHRNGSYDELGDLGSSGVVVRSSPDGTRWLWSTSTPNGNVISSAIHLGGDGLTPHVVESATEANRALRPYEWTAVGAFVEHGAVGIGGYIPFLGATGPVDRLNVETKATMRITNTDKCGFSDMAMDGTFACFPAAYTVRIVYPEGRTTDIPLARPRFNLTGDSYFSQDGMSLTVAGAEGNGANGQGERFGTDVIKTSDASINRLALNDVRPADFMRAACWLPDGSLVVYRPSYAADPSGVFIASPSGGSTTISNSGEPVGLLSG